MTNNCSKKLNEITSTAKAILDEDVAALSRMSERIRIEKYNEIKEDQQTLKWDFRQECPNYLEEGKNGELDRIRGSIKLARLLIAASFYKDGELPPAMRGDFAKGALKAAVDFERYKQFDVLSEDQINRRIRRMEGEVYELVKEYTDTQLANMDQLIDDPSVQQDLISQLTNRYDERLEMVRQGFFIYVEERGLGNMVTSMEEAIQTVSSSRETQKQVQVSLENEVAELSEQLEKGFKRQRDAVEQRLQSVERAVATSNPDVKAIRQQLEDLHLKETQSEYKDNISDLEDTISATEDLKQDLEEQINDLQMTKEQSIDNNMGEVKEEFTSIVNAELSNLDHQRDQLQGEIQRLKQERKGIEAARSQLDVRQRNLQERVDDIVNSVGGDDSGIDGESIVTPTIARLLELDYIGRFETSIHEASTLRLADEMFTIPDDYWGDRGKRRNDRQKLTNLLDDNQDPEHFPVNITSHFEVTNSKYLGLSKETKMVVEASVVANLEAHATNEFDASAADLDQLLRYINSTVQEAEDKDVTHLIGIASPTGWTENARNQISNEGVSRTRFSRYVTVVLIDLQNGEVIFDDSDPVARENRDLFELPVEEERVTDCVSDIEEMINAKVPGEVVILDAVAEKGYDHHIIKRAFDRVSAHNGYSQRYVDDHLILSED